MVEEMQWASHGAIKATELHNEEIAIKIVAPTEPHIRAYITVGGGYPLNGNLCPQRKRMAQIHQLVILTGLGVHCNASRQSLKTSQTRNCGNLWRISVRRAPFANSMQPPAILNQLPGLNPLGAVTLMRMTRRSPSHEGESRFP